MDIDVYSDVVCPWCYIGKRRLERALESFPGEVRVTWRPFQLDPDANSEPQPLIEYLAARFGGTERAREMAAHTTATARGEGLDLRYDSAIHTNTFEAHRLIWFAGSLGPQAEIVEASHRAHFTDGLDIGSRPVLASLAAGAGLDEREVLAFLDSDSGVAEVRKELTQARQLGISAVPTFVFGGRYAVSGARDPGTLRAVLDEVSKTIPDRSADRPV